MNYETYSYLLFLTCLVGCVFVPKDTHSYDKKCDVMRKKKVLKLEQTGPIANCSNDACALLLASYGFVTAASFVVSGSIVVVSNTVYWLEKQSDCNNLNKEGNS